VINVEFVLEAGTAAALDRDAQLGAATLAFEDFANAAGGPLADGDGCGHLALRGLRHTQFIWYPAPPIVKCVVTRNQMDKD
jgi:hypothetical protein